MGGRIFAIGGKNIFIIPLLEITKIILGHDSRNYLNTVEAYDPITGKWEDIAPINQKRFKTLILTFKIFSLFSVRAPVLPTPLAISMK